MRSETGRRPASVLRVHPQPEDQQRHVHQLFVEVPGKTSGQAVLPRVNLSAKATYLAECIVHSLQLTRMLRSWSLTPKDILPMHRPASGCCRPEVDLMRLEAPCAGIEDDPNGAVDKNMSPQLFARWVEDMYLCSSARSVSSLLAWVGTDLVL